MPVEQAAGQNETEAVVVALYERCYPRVVRYIALRTGDTHEAEDLASEVFIRALRAANRYQDTGRPMEAWIFRIAHNLVVDHLRQRNRRLPQVPLDETLVLASEDSAHSRLERSEDVRQLNQAIAQLTTAQRQVVALRFGAGLRPDEIAEVVGKKSGAVRWLQHAALERLRTILSPGSDGHV